MEEMISNSEQFKNSILLICNSVFKDTAAFIEDMQLRDVASKYHKIRMEALEEHLDAELLGVD